MPLNVMAVPHLPAVKILQQHGVRRLSAGSAIAQAALGRTRQLATDFLAGNLGGLFDATAQYGAVNQLRKSRGVPLDLPQRRSVSGADHAQHISGQ